MLCSLQFNMVMCNLGVFMDIVEQQTKQIVSNGLQFNQPYKCIEQTAAIVNNTPNASTRLPRTIYKIKQLIKAPYTLQYYVQCSDCKTYSSSSSNNVNLKCDDCDADIKRTTSNFFVYIPLEQQIKKYLNEQFNEIMEYEPEKSNSGMTDVH